VRRANVRELREQIRVGPYIISRYLSIGKDREKDVNGIISKCPSISRIGRLLAGIIREDVRQQNPCRPLCFLPL